MRLATITTAVIAALAALAVTGPAGAARQSDRAAAPIKITVTAGEFYFKFTKAKVPKGSTVVFTVVNKGQLAHNLVFQSLNKHTPLLSPGKKATLRITFTKAGHYYYLCSVPNHAESGMAGSFTVT
jgi:uncharacterized cupredoxin-like copper-binding protein